MSVTFNPFTGNLDFVGVGAAATPGGSDTQVQFNDDGDFGGDAGLVFNKSTNKLTAGGDIELNDGGTNTLTLQTVTPTAARTISFPDATGTVGLVAGSSGQLIINDSGAYAGVSTATVSSGNITLTGRFISSLNGALSATGIAGVPIAATGTWITGGTATTTKPQVLIEPTGATSTAWSTSGTGFGVNAASGFAGNLLDLQVNGTRQLAVRGSDGSVLFNSSNFFGIVPSSNTLNFFETDSISRLRLTSAGITIPGTDYLAWSSNTSATTGSPDTFLRRDGGANTLALRNGGTDASPVPQSFHIYNWYAAANAHEKAYLSWSSNEFRIGTDKGAASGDATPLLLQTNGVTRLTFAAAGGLTVADAQDLAVGSTTGTKIGTATTQKLGFYNATPVVQPTAVADITTVATVGTLPTPDGSVTIADAATPTVTELLEYCVELEAKLEAALGHLRTLGLIAT